MSIIFLMILELVAVMWVYGFSNFIRDIEFMLKRKTGLYWKICWIFFNPIFLGVVFVYSQIVAKPLTYGAYVFSSFETGELVFRRSPFWSGRRSGSWVKWMRRLTYFM